MRLYREDCVRRTDAHALRVTGKIPNALTGVLYHIGPAAGALFGETLSNAFSDADGVISAVHIERGTVSLRVRPIETRFSREEAKAGRRLFTTFSTSVPGGWARRLRLGVRDAWATLSPFAPYVDQTMLKDPANHVLCRVGPRLVALAGAGRPYDVDPITLECQPASFSGSLPRRALFLLGESRVDPSTGRRCFVELYPYGGSVRLWELNDEGRACCAFSVPAGGIPMLHDFGLTHRKVILPLGPISMTTRGIVRYIAGQGSFVDAFRWRPEGSMRFVVVDRSTGYHRTYTLPGAFPVHVANAFDVGDDVVVDLNVHPNDAAIRGYTAGLEFDEPPGPFRSRLHRVQLRADGSFEQRGLCETDCEAPVVSGAVEGRRHRHIYAFEPQRGIVAGRRICKVDTETAVVTYHDFGAHHVASEPAFVVDPHGHAEDDGWVLTQVYDGKADGTWVSVVDARAMNEVARIDLGVRLPYLLHGIFESFA